jgi:hypothetical protein
VKLKPLIEKIIAKCKSQNSKLQKGPSLIKGGIILVIIFLALLLVATTFGPKRKPTTILPSPIPPPADRSTEEINQPSVYATDEAVLKIENNLKELEQKLQTEDLKETGLNPPVLDFEVKF